jgi:hypothetical protein
MATSFRPVALFTKILTIKNCRNCKTKIKKSFTKILTIILSVKIVLTLRVKLLRASGFLFFSLTIKDKTKISLTIKILHLGQSSFTRKVRTIFTIKIIVSMCIVYMTKKSG